MKRLKIVQSRGTRIASLLVKCVWMLAAVVLLLGTHSELPDVHADPYNWAWKIAAWPLATLAALLVAHGLLRVFKPKPRLILTETGMEIAHFGLGFVPWEEIREARGVDPRAIPSLHLMNGPFPQAHIAIELVDPKGFLHRLNASARRRSRWEGYLAFAGMMKFPDQVVPVLSMRFWSRRNAAHFTEQTVARINDFRRGLA